MAAQKLRLQVLTPQGEALNKEVDFLTLRAAEGEMGILPGHEARTVLLQTGILKAYVEKAETDRLALLEGFATIRDNVVTVLSNVAEHPDHIEEKLEELRRERAENALREQKADAEIQRAEMALRRALVKSGLANPEVPPREQGDE